MRVCKEPGCPTLIADGTYRGECPTHRREADKNRGTRAERGYGAGHQAARRAWQAKIDAGEDVRCWRCGTPIRSTAWHLGHDDVDRSVTRGPECVPCNLAAAGRASHRT